MNGICDICKHYRPMAGQSRTFVTNLCGKCVRVKKGNGIKRERAGNQIIDFKKETK